MIRWVQRKGEIVFWDLLQLFAQVLGRAQTPAFLFGLLSGRFSSLFLLLLFSAFPYS